MNLSATILLAFGMSMDAFAASIGKGATLHKPKFSEAVRTGLIFGAIETLTPLVGWGLGMLASQFILEWNHWIAFILLVFLGGRMIVEGFRGDSDEACEAPHRHGFWLLVTTAFATSLDAMAVGVGLAFLQVSIVTTALAIGCATFIMSTLGMMVGRFMGPLLGKRAEILGGIVLIGIGSEILWSHFAG
ncbi:manganese efflux pump MntP [Klebsiella pneumoniae]|nr:manganese efflux pump MntP [Klebsiella pneumoniae]